MRRHRLVSVGLLCAALWISGSASAWSVPQENRPSFDGVYVYGYVAIDLALGVERAGLDYGISDCSDADVQCLSGVVFNLSIPVRCEDRVNDEWGHGDHLTQVLRREESDLAYRKLLDHMTIQPLLLIGNPTRPHVVYLYARQGVVGLYYDSLKRYDLVRIAREHGLEGLRSADGALETFYIPRTTVRGWGLCRF